MLPAVKAQVLTTGQPGNSQGFLTVTMTPLPTPSLSQQLESLRKGCCLPREGATQHLKFTSSPPWDSGQIQPTVLEFESSKLQGQSQSYHWIPPVLWRATLGPFLHVSIFCAVSRTWEREKSDLFWIALFFDLSFLVRWFGDISQLWNMILLKPSWSIMSGFDHFTPLGVTMPWCWLTDLEKWFFEGKPSFLCVKVWLTGTLTYSYSFASEKIPLAVNLNAKRRKR